MRILTMFRQHAQTLGACGRLAQHMGTVPSLAMLVLALVMVALGRWCAVVLDFGREAMLMVPQSQVRPTMAQQSIMLSSQMTTLLHGQNLVYSSGQGLVHLRAQR